MSFDFFNTSHLAFGSKLTQAFSELDRQLSSAESNLARLEEYLEIVNIYSGRNYRVALPTAGNKPVRTNELYDSLKGKTAYNIFCDSDNSSLSFRVTLYNQSTHLITKASGFTTLREGYAYVKTTITNNLPEKTITFVKDETPTKGTLLFKFRKDKGTNFVNLTDVNSMLMIDPGDFEAYRSISKGSTISFPYTADDYEAICVIGQVPYLNVKLNGKEVIKGGGIVSKRYAILYLKPGDVVSAGSIQTGFKINYGI